MFGLGDDHRDSDLHILSIKCYQEDSVAEGSCGKLRQKMRDKEVAEFVGKSQFV